MLKTLPSIQDIIEFSQIHPLKVRNIYLFGSQVYGYANEYSDYDFIVVAPNLINHSELRNEKFNVHVVTPDKFKNDLINDYYITYLECYYAPDWAKLQEKEKYNLIINSDKLKQKLLSQSHNNWRNAKMKMNEGDIERGVKSAYHSLKVLKFGLQILKYNSIVDFSECNQILNEIENKNFYEWNDLKDEYLNIKIELENLLKHG